jgi:pimeloyl-ACP methyl ester carboxylesterase
MNIDPAIKFDHAQVGGTRLHYAIAGEGDELVLLLHGFPECWYSWRHQLPALSERYTVVAPDLRGYNLSDKPKGVSSYRIDELADDVIGLIHHFRREKAAVIGHDWGAAIAWHIGFEHPQYLSKLGAFQVPPPSILKRNYSLRQFAASWYMLFFQLPYLPEFLLGLNDFALLRRALKETTAERGIIGDSDIDTYKKAWSEPGALTTMLNYYRANVLSRFMKPSGIEKKITVPTLFVYGQQDTAIIPESVRGVGDVIDAKFEQFLAPTAAHWIQQEIPNEINDILLEFLAS